jgi:hypothetical protein
MRARDLAVEYETVSVDSDAMEAARLMAEHNLPGLLVVDGRGEPKAVLPASQMIKILVPAYVIEDPTLAAVVDEKHADRLCQALAGRPRRHRAGGGRADGAGAQPSGGGGDEGQGRHAPARRDHGLAPPARAARRRGDIEHGVTECCEAGAPGWAGDTRTAAAPLTAPGLRPG